MWELSVRGGPTESSGTVPATSKIFFSPAGVQDVHYSGCGGGR